MHEDINGGFSAVFVYLKKIIMYMNMVIVDRLGYGVYVYFALRDQFYYLL
jgi:hypothetical protein